MCGVLAKEEHTGPSMTNPYMAFCEKVRRTSEWKSTHAKLPVAQQGKLLGQMYRDSQSYRGAGQVNETQVKRAIRILREHYEDFHDVRPKFTYDKKATPSANAARLVKTFRPLLLEMGEEYSSFKVSGANVSQVSTVIFELIRLDHQSDRVYRAMTAANCAQDAAIQPQLVHSWGWNTRRSQSSRAARVRYRSQKRHPPPRVAIAVTNTDQSSIPNNGFSLLGNKINIGCISVARIIFAKLILDALLKTKKAHYYLKIPEGVSRNIKLFLDDVVLHGNDNVVVEQSRSMLLCMKSADIAKGFLTDYFQDLGLSFAQSFETLRQSIKERALRFEGLNSESEDDADIIAETRYGVTYSYGLNEILREYFERPYFYARNPNFNRTLRANVTLSSTTVCVGVVMLCVDSIRQYPNFPSLQLKEDEFRMQGIVSCPICRYFYHLPIGDAFLQYISSIVPENTIVRVSPKGNEAWAKKLRTKPFITVDQGIF